MTRVDFYFNCENRLSTACSLCQKAYRSGKRLFVYAPDRVIADEIDRQLWTRQALSFIPHCRVESPLADQTPILIGNDPNPADSPDILLNLDQTPPGFFSRFERVLEVVGTNLQERRAGRERYRFYRERGYDLNDHDLASSSP
jgi:DNA polymerase III subunit chi